MDKRAKAGLLNTVNTKLYTVATCNLNQWALDFPGNLERISQARPEVVHVCLSISQLPCITRPPHSRAVHS